MPASASSANATRKQTVQASISRGSRRPAPWRRSAAGRQGVATPPLPIERKGRRSPSWSSQAERRARRRAEARPSARSAAAWQRRARSPPSASHRAGQTSLHSREHDVRLEEGTPVDDRHGAIHAKPDACDDGGHVPRVPTWASCTPGDFFQQLPAVRPQFEHRGGPGHEQPPATGSADHFP